MHRAGRASWQDGARIAPKNGLRDAMIGAYLWLDPLVRGKRQETIGPWMQ
jgi:hypothetical protein